MFVSICIPTYHSGEKLERLLNSIQTQTFKDYEVVISDDSRDNSISQLIEKKYSQMGIKYFHSESALGTPENWNNAVAKTSGDWIKIMHHDDWFRHESALQRFVDTVKMKPEALFIFSAFRNVYLDKGSNKEFYCSKYEIFLLRANYLNLFKTFMGNPSCTFISSKCKPYSYDKNFKWLIDFDFYTTLFKTGIKFGYLNEAVIDVGMHSGQVTAFVFRNASVEIPESTGLLQKHSIGILRNIYVYDFFWRLYRNINVIDIREFEKYLGGSCPFISIKRMLAIQSFIGIKLLRVGVISKLFMTISYALNLISKQK
jgi:glycosyltransferase involved in cell wall biosynthesis